MAESFWEQEGLGRGNVEVVVMEKKNVLRNAILLSLLVGATAVYSPAAVAAEEIANEDAMEFAM